MSWDEAQTPQQLMQEARQHLDFLLQAGYAVSMQHEDQGPGEDLLLQYRRDGVVLQLEFADYRWRLEGVALVITLQDPAGHAFSFSDLQAIVPPSTKDFDPLPWLATLARHHLQEDPSPVLEQLKEHQRQKQHQWEQESLAQQALYRKLAVQTEEHPGGTLYLLPNTEEVLGKDFWQSFPDHPRAEQQPLVWLVITGFAELVAQDHASALDFVRDLT